MNPLTPYMVWIKLGLVAALLAGVYWLGDRNGAERVQGRFDKHLLADKAAEVKAITDAREHERQDALRFASEAEAYERGKRDAEAVGKRVADDLRTGAMRLRREWQGCETERLSGAATRPAEPDAIAADRNESAGRIIRAAREADEQIKGLQNILRAERQQGLVK